MESIFEKRYLHVSAKNSLLSYFVFIFQRRVHETLLESVPMLKEITVSLFHQEICEPVAIILLCMSRALSVMFCIQDSALFSCIACLYCSFGPFLRNDSVKFFYT